MGFQLESHFAMMGFQLESMLFCYDDGFSTRKSFCYDGFSASLFCYDEFSARVCFAMMGFQLESLFCYDRFSARGSVLL